MCALKPKIVKTKESKQRSFTRSVQSTHDLTFSYKETHCYYQRLKHSCMLLYIITNKSVIDIIQCIICPQNYLQFIIRV